MEWQKKGALRKDKMGGDINPTKTSRRSCAIHEVAWTNRSIQVRNTWLTTHMLLAGNATAKILLGKGYLRRHQRSGGPPCITLEIDLQNRSNPHLGLTGWRNGSNWIQKKIPPERGCNNCTLTCPSINPSFHIYSRVCQVLARIVAARCPGADPRCSRKAGAFFVMIYEGRAWMLFCHDYHLRRTQRLEPSTSVSCILTLLLSLLHVLCTI